MKFSPTFLMWNTKNQGTNPMGLCDPWTESFINNQNNYQNIDNKTNIYFCWKALDHSLNNCQGLTQWAFVPLGLTLTYITSYFNKLSKYLEDNKFIDGNRCNHKTVTLPTTFHKPTEGGVCVSSLDTAYWQFTITPKDKFHYQWMLIQ